MGIILDPNVRELGIDHQIFVLHPGRGKRFYNDFIQTKTVFLDIPGADIQWPVDLDYDDTANNIRMGRKIAAWYNGGSKSLPPSRNAADYGVTTKGLQTPHFMREVKMLYSEAQVGDLIIIPGAGYHSEVLFAEIIDDNLEYTYVARYQNDKIPSRKVKFLDATQPKYEFGLRAVRLMQNRQAIIRVQNESEKISFYEYAYGDYTIGDNISGCLIRVTNEEIDPKDYSDNLFLNNLFGAMYLALKQNKLEDFLSLPKDEALDKYYNKEVFYNFSTEIHSPGHLGWNMFGVVASAFIVGMIALAIHGEPASQYENISVENSLSNGRKSVCDMQLENDLRAAMVIVVNSGLWWDDVCKQQARVAKDIGLKTKAQIKN